MSHPEEIAERSKNKKGPESTKLLGSGLKKWWLTLMLPIEDYLVGIKIHPNILTISTLVVSIITGVFYHYGLIFIAGMLVLAGSTFDIFDGRVARAQGLSSESGAFFDSCLDRFSEAFIFLGLLSYFQDSIYAYVVFLILVSTTMVSYTRARAEGLGVKCEVGIMQRTERVVYLGVLSIFNYPGNLITSALGYPPEDYLLKLSLLIMLVFSSYTSVQRMFHVMSELKNREKSSAETVVELNLEPPNSEQEKDS